MTDKYESFMEWHVMLMEQERRAETWKNIAKAYHADAQHKPYCEAYECEECNCSCGLASLDAEFDAVMDLER